MSDSKTAVENVVLYTDGGCKPARGIGGWGIHGYTFTNDIPKTGTGLKDHVPTAEGYLDKGGKGNKVFGVGTNGPVDAVTVLDYINGLGSLIPESTNNQAELMGAMRALETVRSLGATNATLFLDSKYVLQGLTEWITGWEKRQWLKPDGTEVANRSLWEPLVAIYRELQAAGVKITLNWIKGHSGALGNECADENATYGVVAGRKGELIDWVKFSPAKGYWTPKVEPNKMFTNTKAYFNTNMNGAPRTEDGRYIYHMGEDGKEEEFTGKRDPEKTYAVVYLKEPDEVLERIRTYQDSLDQGGFHSFIVVRLENVFKAKFYEDVRRHGSTFLQRATHKLDIYGADEPYPTQLTKDLRPPRLAFNVVDIMTTLERTLNAVLSGKLEDRVITDITEHLYDTEIVKKKETLKLKSSINSSTKSLSLPINYDTGNSKGSVDTTLTVGIDTPTRNALAALASQQPTVRVVSWKESPLAFRHATIVETKDDAGIWAGFYSNLRLLTDNG